MKRILILRCPGAGKSTLARRLAARTGLPLIHLDQMYWQPGWKEPVKKEWLRRLDDALAGRSWIIEGNYSSTLERRLNAADTAILVDVPRMICIARVLRRTVIGFGRTRPDMAVGCPERLNIDFLSYTWTFRSKQLPATLAQLEVFDGEFMVLRSVRDVKACLGRFSSAEDAAGA